MTKFIRVLPALALLAGMAPFAVQAQQPSSGSCIPVTSHGQQATSQSSTTNNSGWEAEAGR